MRDRWCLLECRACRQMKRRLQAKTLSICSKKELSASCRFRSGSTDLCTVGKRNQPLNWVLQASQPLSSDPAVYKKKVTISSRFFFNKTGVVFTFPVSSVRPAIFPAPVMSHCMCSHVRPRFRPIPVKLNTLFNSTEAGSKLFTRRLCRYLAAFFVSVNRAEISQPGWPGVDQAHILWSGPKRQGILNNVIIILNPFTLQGVINFAPPEILHHTLKEFGFSEGSQWFCGTRVWLILRCGKEAETEDKIYDIFKLSRDADWIIFANAGYGDSNVESRDAGRLAGLKPWILGKIHKNISGNGILGLLDFEIFPGDHAGQLTPGPLFSRYSDEGWL